MTDDNEKDEFGDIDWNEALTEWEHTSFDPQVAKDRATAKPGALAGVSRPLYRPPTVSPAVKPRPPMPRISSLSAEEEGTDATRIAHIPDELLRRRDREAQPGARGGVGSFFDTPSTRPPLPLSPDNVEPDAPSEPGAASHGDAEPGAASHGDAEPGAASRGDAEPASASHDDVHQPFDLTPPGEAAPGARGPALLVPKVRKYDPGEVTAVGTGADFAHRRSAVLDDLSEPPPPERVSTVRPAVDRGPLPPQRTWENERPAKEWLSDATREALAARGGWLAEEAQALADEAARARNLLACSEIFAVLGDDERAQALAAEARDLAPSLALAHRQARALMPFSLSACEDYVEALDAEAGLAPAGPAQIHSVLLAAEALRASGQNDAAAHRLEDAARIAPGDVRATVARATQALAGDAVADPALQLPDLPDVAPIAAAIAACLRLRWVDRESGPPAAPVGESMEDAPGDDRSPTDALHRARQALDKGDVARAAPFVAELAKVPELAAPAKWLAASLGATTGAGRRDAAGWLRELAGAGDEEARRALIARSLELNDSAQLVDALGSNGPLTFAEHVTISALGDIPVSAGDPRLDSAAAEPGMQVLAAALTAMAVPSESDREAQIQARARRTAGSPSTRERVRLARLLAASAPLVDIDDALGAMGGGRGAGSGIERAERQRSSSVPPGDGHPAEIRAVALEIAWRAGRVSEVSSALEAWGGGWGSREDGAIGALAAALVFERAGDRARALESFKAARIADPGNEAALRAIASLEAIDLVAEMNELADDLGDGPRAAVARLEAVARGEGILPEPTRAHLLDQAHRADPTLPIASFFAERIARRAGDTDEVLRWIRERRARATDPVEAALDAVREALLVSDREPQLAAERLQEAHRARPNDLALRELYERTCSDSLEARASWREQRATGAGGDARTLLLLEASSEYERAGDNPASLRCAEAAASNDGSLGDIARERAELRMGQVARLADELLLEARATHDARARREAYERLATMDLTARRDAGGAMTWHRMILDEVPDYAPSLRSVEHHLIGEGRSNELEPIAAAIARALRDTGSGECTAHAALASQLRMRAPDAKLTDTRDMVEIAAAEPEPSLWALRMLQAHSRAVGDDASFLSATQRLLDRTSRAAETATLLVLAGEAAVRLGRLEQARALLGRASTEDPSDFAAWALLADVCRRTGEYRAAGEAYEALARCTAVREHQLEAWCDAGHVWLDNERNEERAIVALEAAAALDIAYGDVFERLAHVYTSRKMHVELANVLERRVMGLSDPDERVAMHVRRGGVLLEGADTQGARRAFEAALVERPENTVSLSALADLCASQGDWEAAEQALVRLARLLPTADEQRVVFARLGDLYATHLLNLSRAEVALREVLKRAPDDVHTTEKLIDVYKRQSDAAHAAEFQQELIAKARSPEEKRRRYLELAMIHEHTAHDARRAEQTFEAARREFPQDVGILRALAEFYMRHHQSPAVNILLDRAGGDARRALAAGRVSPALFDILAAVFDLREKKDAARVTRAMLASLNGLQADISAAGSRAFGPSLDEHLAPEGLPGPLRALLARTGDALDHVAAVDLRALKATPLSGDAPLARIAAGVGAAIGVGAVQVFVSQKLGAICVPVGSSPPVVIIGEEISDSERVGPFLLLRALKLVQCRASALARVAPADLAVLVSAWLKCFNPMWQPQGVNIAQVNAIGGRLQAALPRNLDPDVGTMALETAAAIGSQASALGALAVAWGDRVALLALGDPNVALDAIAAAGGAPAGAPQEPRERAAWIARTPEARDLIAFAVTDAFAEVRARLRLDT